METKSKIKTSPGIVKQLRQQRERLSAKIVDMSYEEQRVYLDKLLQERVKPAKDVRSKLDGSLHTIGRLNVSILRSDSIQ